MVRKVISGGQTGADQAGLQAAQDAGIPTGGWAPLGWKTSIGPHPWLLREQYGLKEYPIEGYRARTWANVKDSDGTIRLAYDFNSPGERCTKNATVAYQKPSLDIELPAQQQAAAEIVAWLDKHRIEVLNIAGNKESIERPVYDQVVLLLKTVFCPFNGQT